MKQQLNPIMTERNTPAKLLLRATSSREQRGAADSGVGSSVRVTPFTLSNYIDYSKLAKTEKKAE